MACIELEHLSLTFPIRQAFRRRRPKLSLDQRDQPTAAPIREVRALRDISIQVGDGERVGIIGQNGAGKSTLLKVIAGIYPPTAGRRHVEGKISGLFKLDLGFELDASGWENIMYRGYLQGETPRSIRAKIGEIAEFSELGQFLDMPVRYYSAGMLFRLGFSIATAIEPEVLLVDEVFSAGDLAFQRKARQRMQDMIAAASLLVIVSHELETLPELCDRGVWLENGTVRYTGLIRDVIAAYTESVQTARSAAA